MINEKLKEILLSLEEDNSRPIIFRYSELTRAAQVKLVKLIKAKSRIWTVKSKITHQNIDECFRLANPIIFENYGTQFTGGQFPASKETELSSLVYNLNKKKISSEAIRTVIGGARKNLPEETRRRLCPTYWEREEDRLRETPPTPVPEEPLRNLDNELDEILRADDITATNQPVRRPNAFQELQEAIANGAWTRNQHNWERYQQTPGIITTPTDISFKQNN